MVIIKYEKNRLKLFSNVSKIAENTNCLNEMFYVVYKKQYYNM